LEQCELRTKKNLSGYICCIYFKLGSPVVCGYGPEEIVDYNVAKVKIDPDDSCTSEFKALKVSGYGQEIIDRVAEWEKYEKKLNMHRPLRFGR
jgi:hypothetical protein